MMKLNWPKLDSLAQNNLVLQLFSVFVSESITLKGHSF